MATEKLLAEWFWIDRWMGSSAFGLNLESRGLYREMLTQAWRRGAWLPNDHDQIRRFVGVTSSEWKRTWKFVERFWRVDGDRLVNDTQLEVYSDACGRQQRASDRGVAGANARHKKHLSDAQASTQASAQAKPEYKPPISDLHKELIRADAEVATTDRVLERARQFIERYPLIYAQERNGARYPVKEARDFPTFLTLVQNWSDDERLDGMFRVFLHLKGRDVLNQPGSPGQFLHHAPECDQLLRANGR